MASSDRSRVGGPPEARAAAALASHQQGAEHAAGAGSLGASSLVDLRPRPAGGCQSQRELEPAIINV